MTNAEKITQSTILSEIASIKHELSMFSLQIKLILFGLLVIQFLLIVK